MKQNDVTDAELREMFEHVDRDGGGSIGLAEFKRLLYVDSSAPLQACKQRCESVPGQIFLRVAEGTGAKRIEKVYCIARPK